MDAEDRLDLEHATACAIKQALSQWLGNSEYVTNEEVITLAKQFLPHVFDTEESLLAREYEPPLVGEYRERARAKSLADREVTAVELLTADIEENKKLLLRLTNEREQSRRLRSRQAQLERALVHLSPARTTESSILVDDFNLPRGEALPLPERRTTRTFQLSRGKGKQERRLTLRLLHPNPPEEATGADLVYEIYRPQDQTTRIALVQYKIWDGKVLYYSQARNLSAQTDRLRTHCEDWCLGAAVDSPYRLPYCCAFLRPTNQFQSRSRTTLSRGVIIPVCALAKRLDVSGPNEILRGEDIRDCSLLGHVFEHLFRAEMAGSRPIHLAELQDFYSASGIFDQHDRIICHATQELPYDGDDLELFDGWGR